METPDPPSSFKIFTPFFWKGLKINNRWFLFDTKKKWHRSQGFLGSTQVHASGLTVWGPEVAPDKGRRNATHDAMQFCQATGPPTLPFRNEEVMPVFFFKETPKKTAGQDTAKIVSSLVRMEPLNWEDVLHHYICIQHK